jgi:drug/metabolite transporter (DMT)-like permease
MPDRPPSLRIHPPPEPVRSDPLTDAGLVLLTIIWGVNFSVVKWALDWLDPMAFNALRFPLAALTVYAVLRIRGRIPRPQTEDIGGIVLLGVAGNAIYQLLFIHALDLTRAGNVALFLATTPAWAAILSWMAREGTMDLRAVIGVGFTLAGMILVVLGGDQELAWGARSLLGDLLAAAAAFTWALYTVGSRRYVLRYGSVPVTAWTLWTGSFILVLLGVPALLDAPVRDLPTSVWGAIAFAGILALGVSYLLWYRGVGRLGSARTATYSNLIPIVALITAWITLGESPAVLQGVGAMIILAGVLLARPPGWLSLRPR